MSLRSRPHDHEAPWAQELSRAQPPVLERQAAFAEEKLRAEGNNLAEVRAEWARFAADNPLSGEAIHQQYIRATNLAYARIVDDLLRRETGEGLRERHAPSLEDFDRWMDEVPALDAPADVYGRSGHEAPDERESEAREAAGLQNERPSDTGGQHMRTRDSDTDERHHSPDPSVRPAPELPPGAAPLRQSSPRQLSDKERRQVQAEADEAFLRGVPAADRPAEVPPEAWYAQRARALDDDARASVEREVTRLSPLPQLSTAEAVRRAVEQTTAEFERPHEEDPARLRTRLYALSLLHEARVDAERAPPGDAQARDDEAHRTEPQRDLISRTEPEAITPGTRVPDRTDPTPRELTDTEPLRLAGEGARAAPQRPVRDIAEATTAVSQLRLRNAVEAGRQAPEPEAPTQPHALPQMPVINADELLPSREAPEPEQTERDFFPAERAEAAYARSQADARPNVSADAPAHARAEGVADGIKVPREPYRFNPDEYRPYDSDVHNVIKHIGYEVTPSLIERLQRRGRPEETLELHTRDILELRTDSAPQPATPPESRGAGRMPPRLPVDSLTEQRFAEQARWPRRRPCLSRSAFRCMCAPLFASTIPGSSPRARTP